MKSLVALATMLAMAGLLTAAAAPLGGASRRRCTTSGTTR